MLEALGHQGDIKHTPSHQEVHSKLTYCALMHSPSYDVIKCAYSAKKKKKKRHVRVTTSFSSALRVVPFHRISFSYMH
jgi:hypothetical protein